MVEIDTHLVFISYFAKHKLNMLMPHILNHLWVMLNMQFTLNKVLLLYANNAMIVFKYVYDSLYNISVLVSNTI